MHLDCIYLNSAYSGIAKTLIGTGASVSPRGLKTREQLGVSLRVERPLQNILYHPARHLNYKFMVAEFLWILFGYDDVKTISKYNSKYVDYSDDGVSLWGAYGPRLQVNLPYALGKLKEDHDTRQAVVEIWRTPWQPTKDVPCTLTLQFIWRDELNLIVNMRSSDIWLGLPYDYYVFSQLLNLMCYRLDAYPGFIQLNLGSSHLYESNHEQLCGMVMMGGPIMCLGSDQILSPPPPGLAAVLNDPDQPWSTVKFDHPWDTFKEVLIHPRADALAILTGEGDAD